ncbi:MAG: four helix bundle protein [Gemmatimonadetes bacterium]|nr:MAG: four helix bundle protein [Gemmatimonadota bacterium]
MDGYGPRNYGCVRRARIRQIGPMRKYRSLVVWQRAHRLSVGVLRATDRYYHPRSRAVFDQVRRAALSVEANIVEGYALSTPLQFRRHLRIALGSAAEVECFLEVVGEVEYLPRPALDELMTLTDLIIGNLFGLVRKGLPTKA